MGGMCHRGFSFLVWERIIVNTMMAWAMPIRPTVAYILPSLLRVHALDSQNQSQYISGNISNRICVYESQNPHDPFVVSGR
jgi:hypothetical protein